MKYLARPSITTIPPYVCDRSEDLDLNGTERTTASVLAALLARNIAYTFWPGTS